MHRKLGALLASLALGLAGALALAGPAAATDPAPLTAGHEAACQEDGGVKVTLTFVNTTGHGYSADVQADREAGTPDEVTGQFISGGPHEGKPFGKRFNPVPVPANSTVTETVTFGEDSGEHAVRYRIWRGPENDYYVDWKGTGKLDTDCLPAPDPTDEPTDDPTSDPTDDPSADPSESPSESPTAEPSESASTAPVGVKPPGDLPVTGSSLTRLLIGGGGLMAAGVGLLGSLWFARRRGWLFG